MTGRFAPRRSSAGVYTMSAKLNSLQGMRTQMPAEARRSLTLDVLGAQVHLRPAEECMPLQCRLPVIKDWRGVYIYPYNPTG